MLTSSNKFDILNQSNGKTDFLCQHSPLVCEDELTVLPFDRRGGAFLLEEKMKVCRKCNQEKPLSEFGKNRGYYRSHCNQCRRQDNKIYKKNNPWRICYNSINFRCTLKTHRYYKRGIKNFITVSEIKQLWFRDKAYLMKKPSIDRIDNDGNYIFANCRFIELVENCRRAGYARGWLTTCKIKDCDRKAVAREMCKVHYNNWYWASPRGLK